VILLQQSKSAALRDDAMGQRWAQRVEVVVGQLFDICAGKITIMSGVPGDIECEVDVDCAR
jgi:hypothetical protein